jgi:transcriptional regulator with XRE-family HTH domain
MSDLKKHIKKNYKVGRHIQKLRKEKGLTQEELADKLHISLSYVGKIETGLRKPNMKMLYKIAEKLDVKVSELIPF